MNIKDDIKPISYIKTNAADMLKRVNETHNPMIITQNGEAKAVLLDTDTYQKLINTIGILKLISQSENDIEKSDVFDQENVYTEIEKSINDLRVKQSTKG
jgi:prevent-host-death family protein